MRKNLLLAASLVLSLLMVSCNNRVQHQDVSIEEAESLFVRKPEMHLEGSDTSEVLSQVNTFLECLKNNQVSEAVGMLYQLKRDVTVEKSDSANKDPRKAQHEIKYSVVPLPADLARQQREVFEQLHGVDYQLENYEFLRETDCQVKYIVTFENNAKMTFVMKPVRMDGKWFLTMADTEHGEAGKSQIKN